MILATLWPCITFSADNSTNRGVFVNLAANPFCLRLSQYNLHIFIIQFLENRHFLFCFPFGDYSTIILSRQDWKRSRDIIKIWAHTEFDWNRFNGWDRLRIRYASVGRHSKNPVDSEGDLKTGMYPHTHKKQLHINVTNYALLIDVRDWKCVQKIFKVDGRLT